MPRQAKFRQQSLKVVFICSTLLQVVTAVGLTGYFSMRNGQQAVNDVATQLRNEVTNRVKDRLQRYIAIPHLINNINASIVDLGESDSPNVELQERFFWKQIQSFPEITYNFYGSETGEYLGARRLANGNSQVIRRNQTTGENQYFAVSSQGNRTQRVQVVPSFDARLRPWYRKAVQAKKPVWSETYTDFSTEGLAITAVRPLYNQQGKLQGVLGSDFIFSQVSEFLRSLKIGQTGKTFIIERSGELIATSTDDPVYQLSNGKTQRILAMDSRNPMIRSAAQHLQQKFKTLDPIKKSLRLNFVSDGARQFMQVTPLQDDKGLDWLIVVVVPEADFMGRIDANTRTTVWLCLLSLGVATLVGLQTSRSIVHSLLKLNRAAKQLAEGCWDQDELLLVKRSDEIGELAASFNRMREQLKESFNMLEQKVAQRTVELAQSNRDLENTNALIRKIFGRYLSNEIVATLLESPTGLALGGERRKITILTSDLRGFTTLSERLPPEEVLEILNFYLEYMADVITNYGGTIDEFMGDGILALFGAPTSREDDTERAVACAIAMQLAMQPVNEKMQQLDLSLLEMGIGIHTGEVVVGNIGSEKRTKYGVVGSQVNLTYRIESCSLGGQVLVSEAVMDEIGTLLWVNSTKQVQLKGIQHPTLIYEVVGIAGNYNLFLVPTDEEKFVDLFDPLLLQYILLDGKEIGNQSFSASLTKLSAKEALIELSEFTPQPLTNLKINFSKQGAEMECYAKVLDRPTVPGSFYIHFTSMPPKMKTDLEALYKSIKKIEFPA
jgi:class 3 adenylate cyclase/HAMP domain-containing protein